MYKRLMLALTISITPPAAAGEQRDQPRHASRKSSVISLDLQETDIRAALRMLADAGGVNIVLHRSVQGKVTLRLVDVPWRQALESVIRAEGLYTEERGNVMLVYPLEDVPEIIRGSR